MARVTVIDSIMGTGKTSWALQYVNDAPVDRKFIYITPFLDEVQRVITSTALKRQFHEPSNRSSDGTKFRSLKQLIVAGYDICSTHSLFQKADDELIELLTESGYTLILDEVMNVIEQASIIRKDIVTMIDGGLIAIDGNRVIWTDEDYVEPGGRFADIRALAKAGNLFIHRDRFLIWTFPPRVFNAFDDVFILTYLFNAQLQRYYYDLHQIPYTYRAVRNVGGRYDLTEYDRRKENRAEVMTLIDLYGNGPFNDIGERRTALSASWLRNADADILDRVRKNVSGFLRNHCSAKSEDILWTTLKECQHGLRGKGYSNAFIPVNIRATNEYSDRWALAYVFNRFLSPIESAFFEDNGVTVNPDLLAVSDLLQWIWRSRIRNGQPVKLYLPSSRMRALLLAWSRYEL